MAVLGHENDSGKFEVEDYCLSDIPYQERPRLDEALMKGEDRWDVGGQKRSLGCSLLFVNTMKRIIKTSAKQSVVYTLVFCREKAEKEVPTSPAKVLYQTKASLPSFFWFFLGGGR